MNKMKQLLGMPILFGTVRKNFVVILIAQCVIIVEKKVWYIASFSNVCGSRRHVLSLISFFFFYFIKEHLIKKKNWHAVGTSITVWQNQLLFCAMVTKTGFLFEIPDKNVKALFLFFFSEKPYFRKQLIKSKSIFSFKSIEIKID